MMMYWMKFQMYVHTNRNRASGAPARARLVGRRRILNVANYVEQPQESLNPRQDSEEAIEELLASGAFLEDPPGHKSGFVAIIGLPNAGKSTLLNALVGQKLSIVSHKAQSTRRRVLGIVSEDYYQACCIAF
jgi:predicted GTPase